MNLSEKEILHLLSLSLLQKYPETNFLIDQIKNQRKMEIGWHYMLDLAWMIEQVKLLPYGSTLLDAGAGGGLLQYVLVDMGFRVISVDFAPRPKPVGISCIKVMHQTDFSHTYIEHLKSNYRNVRQEKNKPILIHTRNEFTSLLKKTDVRLFLYQADIQDMSLCPDSFVDAVVSVSALEHLEQNHTERAIKECFRVLRPGQPILISTSASKNNDWYHKNSMGWCYSEASLRKLFNLSSSTLSNFANYQEIMDNFKRPGNELNSNLASFYFTSNKNGMPWGIWNPEYLPVVVKKIKGK